MDTTFLHTMIRVKDLDKSIKFYEDCLGLEVTRKSDNESQRYTVVFLGNSNSNAEIELTYNWDNTEEYSEGRKFGHIAFKVDNAEAICKKVADLGYEVPRPAGPVKGGTTIIAFIRDPDNNSIEFIQE